MFSQSPVKIWRQQKKIISFLGKVGTLVSYTVIRVPPVGFEDQAPYPVAIISIGKERLVGQVVDYEPQDLIIGAKFQAVLRRIKEPGIESIIHYGIKFKPVPQK